MNPITRLDEIRRQMVEELIKIPQYRALKEIERCIVELTEIYDVPAPVRHESEGDASNRKIAQVIETQLRGEIAPSVVKNGLYRPVQRVV
jgi:hypothetical protein